MHSALRELQRLAGQPRVWLVLAAISLLMGLVGPFETFRMPLLPRLAYWAGITISTGWLGTIVTLVVVRSLPAGMARPLAAAVGGLVAGAPIALLVWLVNGLVFRTGDASMSLWTLLAYCIPIAGLVTAMGHMLGPAVMATNPDAPTPAQPPALLDRLPLPQRGRLLHLAVNDHYVDVTTERGTTLVLLRLSDAIRETAPVAGLQVHRSHWIALDAVRRTRRQSGKLMVELENGAVVPISRSYLADARAAGLVA